MPEISSLSMSHCISSVCLRVLYNICSIVFRDMSRLKLSIYNQKLLRYSYWKINLSQDWNTLEWLANG